MAIELYDGETEVKRVKESEIGWIEEKVDLTEGPPGAQTVRTIETSRRDHPVKDGQRWVLDTATDEWVLCEKRGKKK